MITTLMKSTKKLSIKLQRCINMGTEQWLSIKAFMAIVIMSLKFLCDVKYQEVSGSSDQSVKFYYEEMTRQHQEFLQRLANTEDY